jgi:hypothetical protein
LEIRVIGGCGRDWEGDLKWKSSRWAATAVCFVLKLWKGEGELGRGVVEAPEITRFSVDWEMEYEEKPGNKSEFLDLVNLAIIIIVHHYYLQTMKLDFS